MHVERQMRKDDYGDDSQICSRLHGRSMSVGRSMYGYYPAARFYERQACADIICEKYKVLTATFPTNHKQSVFTLAKDLPKYEN